jgi:uncharacterized membrane protein (UPF0182 family)
LLRQRDALSVLVGKMIVKGLRPRLFLLHSDARWLSELGTTKVHTSFTDSFIYVCIQTGINVLSLTWSSWWRKAP